ncbi:hypothetical protein GL2_19330 [Microbulbifer sp. GL-2]|nr:hypothetical protein GL2_19330 [Microbulbifer sp. GL-2]
MASYIQSSFNIHFTVIEPGGIYSEFANSVLLQLESDGAIEEDDYQAVFQQYFSSIRQRTPEQTAKIYQTADQVAQVVVKTIENEDPPVRVRTSEWGEEFCGFKTEADPTGKKQQKMVVDSMLFVKSPT